MSAQEEVGDIVKEGVENAIDKVKDELVKEIGTDSDEIVAIIEEMASMATTVVSNEVKDVVNNLGIKLISESDLSEEQKAIATNIYDSSKKAIQSFISDQSVNNTIKITRIISQVIRQLETATLNGKAITGQDKKIIAIHLGRILIKEVTPDDKCEAEIIILYDMVAEPTLEAMIEVSKAVNVTIKEISAKCCPGLLTLFKRK